MSAFDDCGRPCSPVKGSTPPGVFSSAVGHQTPNGTEMTACRPWLETEIALVQPTVVVALGATAAQTFLGRQFRVTKQRGVPLESPLHPCVVATVHPSSILRAPDEDARREAMRDFVADLRTVAEMKQAADRPGDEG